MQNDPRSRILLLLQLLLEQTDEHHYVSGTDILRFLASHGIQATRKNVYSDIRLLMDFGLDIICIKSTQNRYFIGSRLLELPELKLLVDAVESSHLITEKKSAALIEKFRPPYQQTQRRAPEPPRLHGRHGQAGQRGRVLRHRRDPDGDSQTTGHLLPVFRVHAEKGKRS